MIANRLAEVAPYIVARNVPATISAVVVSWHASPSLLGLHFYSDASLTDEHYEDCELALTELYADVWQQVERMESRYCVGTAPAELEPYSWIVYTQPNNSSKPTQLRGVT